MAWPRGDARLHGHGAVIDRGGTMGDDFFMARRGPGVRLAGAYVRGHGGTFSHVLQALGEFHARLGHWPTRLHLRPETLAALVCDVTPLGLYLLQIHVSLVSDPTHDFLVADEHGNVHAYHLGRRTLPVGGAGAINAAARWLGYASDGSPASVH